MESVCVQIETLPWSPPSQNSVPELNDASQYAAWVAVHGFNVNHFTSLINSHGVESLNSIDKTVEALRRVGVPMKVNVEGEIGSRLRQTATEAVVIDVKVASAEGETSMPWTYAYFELAERGQITDAESGKTVRFEGFLGPQATHLFDMTRVKD